MDGRLIGGRYRLLEARALGGTASVWRATDERTGRPVAVKLLHPHLAADPAARERLQREALAMGGIDHPNVVAVRDLILDDERPSLVMDFIDGRSLAEVLAERGALPEDEALRVAAEVADGLAAVHAAGLVHRDLKPANILIGADGRARLTDLGIAASAEPGDHELTATDGVAGTLRYLAPERLLGEPATAATDVWGLGVVLVEMLTGTAAFPATSIQARVGAVADGVSRPDGVDDRVWAIIERATADEPTTRYPAAAAIAADLRLLAPESVAATPEGDLDPWADTAVIPLPITRGIAPTGATDATPSPQHVASPPIVMAPVRPAVAAAPARGEWRGGAPRLALLGAAALVLVIAVAALGGPTTDPPRGSAQPGSGVSAPAASAELATASPTVPAKEPDKDDDEGEGGNGDKPGKGKGRGNGKGKDD